MTDSIQETPAVDPIATYEEKMDRLKAMAKRIHEILAEADTHPADDPALAKLMGEKLDLDAEIAELLSSTCGAHRQTPNGGAVTCQRTTGHPDDHFDEIAGIGWANENDEPPPLVADEHFIKLLDSLMASAAARADDQDAGLRAQELFREVTAYVDELRQQLHRAHLVLDRVGVPRGRLENTLTLVHRTNLFVDRLSKRLHGQVEHNMALYQAIRDALTSLVGAPNSGSLRVKTAIERLRAVLPSKKSPGGIHLQ